MSNDHLIPPSVDEHDAALLKRAYDLTSQAESAQLYAEWAETYDRTMLDGLGWMSPQLVSELFGEMIEWRDRPVLDLGCGTGLIGALIHADGFTSIDGLDLSAEMMGVAARRGIYGTFVTADLTAPLPIETGAYAAAICNGTFTSGHVGAECLPEIVRILNTGGVFCCSIHDAVWETLGFARVIDELVADGQIEALRIEPIAFYATSAVNGRICALRKL